MIYSMLDLKEKRWLFVRRTQMEISWVQRQLDRGDSTMIYSTPSPPSSSSSSSSGTKISPAVLFVIVILAVLFFIAGLLHLLVRFLTKHPPTSSAQSSSSNRYPEASTTDALQRQLQQLFHLHDSGLDKAFIDALPVFMYKEIVGAKEPSDCAVCLCEFSEKDKLRLLPTCSHAFHINCIDTWLLSNSTCPLCRGTLFSPGRPIENPVFDFDDMREEDGYHHPSINGENGFSLNHRNNKAVEIEETVEENAILPVRLGKFRKLEDSDDGGAGESSCSSSRLDGRRCFSMGSYQYVVRDANLGVSLRRDCKGNNNEDVEEGKKISFGAKIDSYSVSKIWLWPSDKANFTSSFEDDDHNPRSDLPRYRAGT
ncbi:RING-H2 finger protein ATL46-like [Impatiens glandulifera]|uniref:RING-H2 finger protein ATL46-like n=1 Tax=Impatiens glandulifera TaxID=253017 RepID=UPI001FB06F00|nr:RING-H2 finger protein ATL46-like [Impatiens glandulifera]